jgi:hypothetical protein
MQPKELCESRHIDTAICRSIENLRPAAVTASSDMGCLLPVSNDGAATSL